ncbi:FAD-dependent oxidoreductase [Streptomyces werraensis]|uniref:FAD-dependent oxidoreductase n=1 Tax=Streptomyces werraensis TaxID=68284 RepID=UPI001CE26F08
MHVTERPVPPQEQGKAAVRAFTKCNSRRVGGRCVRGRYHVRPTLPGAAKAVVRRDLLHTQAPARVAVIGAGMVVLWTGWYLQEAGVEVTVLDRWEVAAGSSWGDAGWLTTSLAAPLPEPAVLKYGIRAVLSTPSALERYGDRSVEPV